MVSTMKRRSNRLHVIRMITALAFLCLGVGSFGGTLEAATSYSYIDDHGNPVLTDRLENVPAEYRNKVRRHETGDVASTTRRDVDTVLPGPAAAPSSLQTLIWTIADKVPHNLIPGLTQYQAAVFILGGGAGLFLLVMLFLSSNPAMTLLAKWMLVFVAIISAYFMYFSGGGTRGRSPQEASGIGAPAAGNILQDMKAKTQQSIGLQEERTRQQVD